MKVVSRKLGEIDFVIAVLLMKLVIPVQKELPEYIAGMFQMVERQSLAGH